MSVRFLPIVFVFLLVFFFVPQKIFAVTVSVISIPLSITQDNFTITASVSGAAAGTNYLRIDLYKDGSTNYFGDTYNGSSWYNGSDGTQYFPITIVANTIWNGQIQGRFGNPSLTDFDGTGTYKIRIRRYTASGNLGSGDTLNSLGISILVPTATPTPLPTSTPTPISTATPTPKVPTATPTVKVIQATPKVSPSENVGLSSLTATDDGVLGTSSAFAFDTPTLSPTKVPSHFAGASTFNPVPFIFIGAGCCLLASCGILIFLQYKKTRTLW